MRNYSATLLKNYKLVNFQSTRVKDVFNLFIHIYYNNYFLNCYLCVCDFNINHQKV